MPLDSAAIACSRTPKWKLRPAGFWALKLPTLSKVSRVLFDGAKSAEPPKSQGTFRATWLTTFPDEARLGIPCAGGADASAARRTVASGRVLRVGGALGHMAAADNQRGPIRGGVDPLECRSQGIQI